MCQCHNVEIGTYNNQVILKAPDNIKIFANSPDRERKYTVGVDNCIAEEIKFLWDKGIRTTGCCCGHNKYLGYIGVVNKDIDKMLELGYVVQLNFCGLNNLHRLDSFTPKSVKYTQQHYLNRINHIRELLRLQQK